MPQVGVIIKLDLVNPCSDYHVVQDVSGETGWRFKIKKTPEPKNITFTVPSTVVAHFIQKFRSNLLRIPEKKYNFEIN
jgi:hypothetical protein